MRNRILKNIGWLFFEKIFRSMGMLVVGIFVARYLGPEQFGLLNYAIAFVFFFSFLSDLGLHQIVVRELKTTPERLQSLLGTAFSMKLLGGAIAIVLSAIVIMVLRSENPEIRPLVFLIAAGFIFQSLDVIDYYFQSRILSKYVVLARNVAFLFSGTLKITFILLGLDVFWFAAAGTLDVAFASLFMVMAYKRSGASLLNWGLNIQIARELFKYSWPLMLSALLISIHMRIDQVMIGGILGNAEVGLYSVAVRLTEFWYFIPALIVSSLLPYFIELRASDYQSYLAKLKQLYSLMFWAGVAIGLFMLVAGEQLIVLLLGEVYRSAYVALMLNIWAVVFVFQGVVRGIWLIAEDLQRYRLFNNIFAVCLNIAGNMLLIPRLGIAGAAFATLISQAVTLWIFSLIWKPMRSSTLDLIKAVNPLFMLRGKKY